MEDIQPPSKAAYTSPEGDEDTCEARKQNSNPKAAPSAAEPDPEEQPIELLEFLHLLVDRVHRKDLFDLNDTRTLRLVSSKIKDFADEFLPIRHIKIVPATLRELPRRRSFTEKLKTLIIKNSEDKDDMDSEGNFSDEEDEYNAEYAVFLSTTYVPNLEKFSSRIPIAGDLLKPCITYWPALTCLELVEDDRFPDVMSCLAYIPSLRSLKEFKYSSRADQSWDIVAFTLTKLESLTRLDLKMTLDGDLFQWLLNNKFIESLEELKLDIFLGPTAEDIVIKDAAVAISWPMLRRFGYLLNGQSDCAHKFLLYTLKNSHVLEEVELGQWTVDKFSFRELKSTRMKRLRLIINSFDCYEDLMAANMPDLESLEIVSRLRPLPEEHLARFLSRYPTSPFPVLKSLYINHMRTMPPETIKLLKLLMRSVKELNISNVREGHLAIIFEQGGRSVLSEGKAINPPSWPNLCQLQIRGTLDISNLKVATCLPAHCPSLKEVYLSDNRGVPDTEGAVQLLKQAGEEGVWENMKSVWFSTRRSYQIWPIVD
jgi:hypothetical protein